MIIHHMKPWLSDSGTMMPPGYYEIEITKCEQKTVGVVFDYAVLGPSGRPAEHVEQ